tara:strand:- start:177 stop:857 length:681 start_codon:yes stop_codon:yes gene_type:complete
MKKINVLVICLLFLLSFPLIYSQSNLDTIEKTVENLEQKKEVIEDLSLENIREEYLKQEWEKILEKNKFFGPIINGYKNSKPFVDPIFKYTIGLESSLTWLFILTLVLWITFVVYLYRILTVFSTFSEGVSFIISILLVIIIANLGILRVLSTQIINLITIFTIWWVQLIIILALIIGLIILNKFSAQFKLMIEKWKEKESKEEFEEAKDVAVKFSKGIKDSIKDK